MTGDAKTSTVKPVAILEPEEVAVYNKLVKVLADQHSLVERARAALDQAEFIEQCIQTESVRTWGEVCDAHGIEREVEYVVDGTGRVYRVEGDG